jgi:hypothetical protein
MKTKIIEYDRIMEMISEELESAKNKWPNWVYDPIHASAIISEEAGELAQACLDYSYSDGKISDMIKEACHVGATVIRFLENISTYQKIKTYSKENNDNQS